MTAPPLRFGLVLPIQSVEDDLATLAEQLAGEVRAAERAGFDSVLLTEFHQARGGALVSPLVVLARLIGDTTTIRFGTAVLATPLHHPVRLAEDVVMLDHLTRGRVVLGLGIGHQHPDFRLYGVDRSTRVSRTEEAVAIMEQCFSGEPFSFAGEHFDMAGHVTPKPYSTPRPLFWMGAHSTAGLDRAARLADMWLCAPERGIDSAAVLAERYRAACRRNGSTAQVGLFREAWIGDSAEECERDWAPYAMQVHRLYYNVGVYLEEFEPWVTDVADRADFTLERVGPGRFLYGAAAEITDTVMQWQAQTGASYLALRLRQPGGPGHDATMTAIERFGEEVIGPMGARADAT